MEESHWFEEGLGVQQYVQDDRRRWVDTEGASRGQDGDEFRRWRVAQVLLALVLVLKKSVVERDMMRLGRRTLAGHRPAIPSRMLARLRARVIVCTQKERLCRLL